MASLRLTIEDGQFCDKYGRHVLLRGINVAADAKLPSQPDVPSHVADDFFDGDNVKFHARPFPKDDAPIHFARIRRFGYNTIRYIFTWEAIEAAGPGRYDEQWIQHTIEVLRVAKSYGFYIFMDPHQDVWSRYCGGSGAPMWTIYACGLNPQSFAATEAAIVHNTYPEPEKFPKMIWSTNYYRLAAATIFTLFFAGRDFAPKCIINGINIQDFLQGHFIRACAHLARRIHEAGGIENEVVFGWESLNEPNRGMVGHVDLGIIPKEQQLKKGTCPTLWQSMLTGSGRACEIDTWDIGGLGAYKVGRVLIDPHGEKAWLPHGYDEARYGWTRDPGWELGECVWAQHGVWDPSQDALLKKNYFQKNPRTGEVLDYQKFTNSYFMDFYRDYRDAIRAEHEDAILLCQPPTLEIPPTIRGTADDDPRMVYAPHYYDGITLMTKRWNRTWNVDVFGVLRGRYLHPAFAIKIGESAIRNSFKEQLAAIKKEGQDYMGNHPCILTEFGIPYDMDDKHAYKTGDYSSQSAAMDANHFAVEGARMAGYTLWVYSATNDHRRGDQWNGEDLSVFSLDDRVLPTGSNDEVPITPTNLERTLTKPSMSSEVPSSTPELTSTPGYRAAEAYVRPAPILTSGSIIKYGFDLKRCRFTLDIDARAGLSADLSTIVLLPEYHFPKRECTVIVSSGKWEISTDEGEHGSVQKMLWWHGDGRQSLQVTGVSRTDNTLFGTGEETGYLEQCERPYGVDLKSCEIM